MKTIEVEVGSRTELGKGANRRLRKSGMIPAVLYGASKKNFSIQTATKKMTQIINGHNENAILTLKSADKAVNGKHVLIKEWDRDVLTRLPLHVDLFEIDLTKSVRVKVPLVFTGKAKGLADGGIVSPVVREIEVDCLPTDIPDNITVDVSGLGVNESIHIDELVVPDTVKKHFVDNFTVVTCTYIKEEVIAAVPAEGAATTAEPEVIAKGKKDEEGNVIAKPAAGAAAPAAGAKGAAPAKAPAKK